jgi:hypothetical protein
MHLACYNVFGFAVSRYFAGSQLDVHDIAIWNSIA